MWLIESLYLNDWIKKFSYIFVVFISIMLSKDIYIYKVMCYLIIFLKLFSKGKKRRDRIRLVYFWEWVGVFIVWGKIGSDGRSYIII